MRTPSVGAPRSWAPNGPFVRRCVRSCFAVGQSPSTCSPHPSTTVFKFISHRWSISSLLGQTLCSSLGTTSKHTLSLHSASCSGPHQGSPISEPGVDVSGSLLATEAVVPGSLGAPSGSAGPSAYAEGSTQTTPLSSLPPEPPCASLDWLSHCERSVRHRSLSSRVPRQLAFCRRSSAHVNYQAKWVTYRSWCCSHGHSISCPSVSKIADFLLYLRHSLHVLYSSIASYRFMLSAVFRFVLAEISSHPVLHDLLHSFRIERPLPFSRVPPWDLL